MGGDGGLVPHFQTLCSDTDALPNRTCFHQNTCLTYLKGQKALKKSVVSTLTIKVGRREKNNFAKIL